MIDLERLSPLGGTEAARYRASGLELVEHPFVAQLRLQTLGVDRDRIREIAALAGGLLPEAPNRALGDDPWVLWRGPGDWLAYSLTRSFESLARAFGEPLAGLPLYSTDVSSMYALVELSGERAVDVLMRDLTLDLEGGAIPPGACAQTLFAQVSVLVHRPEPGDRWRLWVDRSAARHLWDWLVDSAELVTG